MKRVCPTKYLQDIISMIYRRTAIYSNRCVCVSVFGEDIEQQHKPEGVLVFTKTRCWLCSFRMKYQVMHVNAIWL